MSTFVQKAYIALFGRPADPAGLTYWEAASATLSEAEVYAQLLDSAEFAATLQSTDITEVLTHVYANVFGRTPDAPGLQFWLQGIEQAGSTSVALGQALADIVRAPTVGSADARTLNSKVKLAEILTERLNDLDHAPSLNGTHLQASRDLLNTVTSEPLPAADVLERQAQQAVDTAGEQLVADLSTRVEKLYLVYLGRPATPSDLTQALQTLDEANGDFDAVSTQVIDTNKSEFTAQYGNLDARDFIDALYQNGLNRAADTSGADYWAEVLAADPSETSIDAYANLALHVLDALGSQTGTRDAAVLGNKSQVAHEITKQLDSQAGTGANFSQITSADFNAIRELLSGVTDSSASVDRAQARATDLARETLAAADQPVAPQPSSGSSNGGNSGGGNNGGGSSQPTTVSVTVDSALETSNAAAGQFKTIQEAIDAGLPSPSASKVVTIKAGTYQENLVLVSNLTLKGEGEVTVISGSDAQTGVRGTGLTDITLQNIDFVQGESSSANHIHLENSRDIELSDVTLSNREAGQGNIGLLLDGVLDVELNGVTASGYGQEGIAVVATRATANWLTSKNIAFKDITVNNNATGIAFYLAEQSGDAPSADIDGVTFSGDVRLSGNDAGIRFVNPSDNPAGVSGALIESEFDSYYGSLEIGGIQFENNRTDYVHRLGTSLSYNVATTTDRTINGALTGVVVTADFGSDQTLTVTHGERVNMNGAGNLHLMNGERIQLQLNAEHLSTVERQVTADQAERISINRWLSEHNEHLTLTADNAQYLELDGYPYSPGSFWLSDASSLKALRLLKISSLSAADVTVSAQSAEQGVTLNAAYPIAALVEGSLTYTASDHGDTLLLNGRPGNDYTLGDGADHVVYVGRSAIRT